MLRFLGLVGPQKHRFFSTIRMATPTLIIEQVDTINLNQPLYKTQLDTTTFNEFIKRYPRGAYTGMRTVEHGSIVELTSHFKRMVKSLSLMNFAKDSTSEDAQVKTAMAPFRDIVCLEGLLVPFLRAGLTEYYANNKTVEEAKISVMVGYSFESHKPCLAAHFCPLPDPPRQRCKVLVEQEVRVAPEIKDSQWVRDRAEMERNKPKDVNEILLTDHAGNVYEGMSSNFFSVELKNGRPVVVCAPLEHILLGTVMKIVMAVCDKEGIEMVWSFPRLQDAKHGLWQGCFITSTSRLLLPIKSIGFKESAPVEFPESSETIELLRKEIQKEIHSRSYRIL
ncbi:aminotransferase [Phycomyces nitens]|nr:aminotransferase [Phycomyces nitens]